LIDHARSCSTKAPKSGIGRLSQRATRAEYLPQTPTGCNAAALTLNQSEPPPASRHDGTAGREDVIKRKEEARGRSAGAQSGHHAGQPRRCRSSASRRCQHRREAAIECKRGWFRSASRRATPPASAPEAEPRRGTWGPGRGRRIERGLNGASNATAAVRTAGTQTRDGQRGNSATSPGSARRRRAATAASRPRNRAATASVNRKTAVPRGRGAGGIAPPPGERPSAGDSPARPPTRAGEAPPEPRPPSRRTRSRRAQCPRRPRGDRGDQRPVASQPHPRTRWPGAHWRLSQVRALPPLCHMLIICRRRPWRDAGGAQPTPDSEIVRVEPPGVHGAKWSNRPRQPRSLATRQIRVAPGAGGLWPGLGVETTHAAPTAAEETEPSGPSRTSAARCYRRRTAAAGRDDEQDSTPSACGLNRVVGLTPDLIRGCPGRAGGPGRRASRSPGYGS
jgi:hypothetical protein